MGISQEAFSFRENLADLQRGSFNAIVFFAGIVGLGYIWLALILWPVIGKPVPTGAWVGIGLLILSVLISHTLKLRQPRLATYLLIWGILGATTCVIFAVESLAVTYLFILPIVFASVLLRRWTVFAVAAVAGFITFQVGQLETGTPSISVAIPIGIISLVTVASWLSVRNLYTALEWVWKGYERARHNEEVALDRQAELKRVLKALDEATYRLERANYMLALARDQAEEARQLKQQFAQTISHELRTPLNLIVSFSELMVQSPEYYGGQLPPAYLRDLSIVERNARHLQSLVNDVLDLARIEAAQMSLAPEQVDPVALVQEAVNTARSLVETRGLKLYTEIKANLPPLWVDPIRIRQVLFNLLNNAARFTEQGTVTVGIHLQGKEVIFFVADTGVGIAPEDISQIFEEFQQVDGSTRRRHGGVGLGLAISRRFVELHGGRIWVESQLGQGSTFYFSLPVSKGDPIIASKSHLTGPASPTLARWNKEEPVLLAITCSPSAAALLTGYMRGCRTIIVSDLEQGRQTAQQLIPQVVLIDTAGERPDSAKLEELGRAWKLPRTPFIACPLPGEEPLRQRLAVEGYLIKPVSRQNLWNVLRRFGEDIDSVLIIDDNHDFVRMMSRMLDNPLRRYQVIEAYNGQEGLTMFHHHRPDLVLLDLTLPDMNGLQIIERLRANPAWRHVPIIIVSAQDEVDHLDALSGTMLITKTDGVRPGEIVQWVQKVLDTTTQP